GFEGTSLWTADLQTEGPAPALVRVTGRRDARHLAPAPAAPEQAAVISTCCIQTEGDLPTEVEFGTVTLTGARDGEMRGEYTATAGVGDRLPNAQLNRQLFVAAAGALDARGQQGQAKRYAAGEVPSWILSDVDTAYLVDANGGVTDLLSSWSGVAVNPTFAPADVQEGS
ncbi:MAG: hypothetical protein ACRDQW_05005, partial [Haloechinothrix sp.]